MRTDEDQFLEGNHKIAIILIHAFTGNPTYMHPLALKLNRVGYSVYLPCLTGHGTKDPMDCLRPDPNQWREDVTTAYEKMVADGYEKIVIMGLSLGGLLATDACERLAVFAGGSFAGPIAHVDNEKSKLMNEFKTYVSRLGHDPIEPEVITGQFNRIKALTTEVEQNLSKITAPFLVVQGGKDEIVDPRVTEKAETLLVNTSVKTLWYPNSPHVLTFGPDRHTFEQDLVDYLNSL